MVFHRDSEDKLVWMGAEDGFSLLKIFTPLFMVVRLSCFLGVGFGGLRYLSEFRSLYGRLRMLGI